MARRAPGPSKKSTSPSYVGRRMCLHRRRLGRGRADWRGRWTCGRPGPLAASFGAVLALEHLEVVHEGRHDDLLVPVAEQVGDDRGGVDAGSDLRSSIEGAGSRGTRPWGAAPPRRRASRGAQHDRGVVAAVAVSHDPVVGDGVGHCRAGEGASARSPRGPRRRRCAHGVRVWRRARAADLRPRQQSESCSLLQPDEMARPARQKFRSGRRGSTPSGAPLERTPTEEMSGIARSRLAEERKVWRKDRPHGFFARPETTRRTGQSSLSEMRMLHSGQRKSTLWEAGFYPLTMEFSEDYPSKPPKCRFSSGFLPPVFSQRSNLCLSILRGRRISAPPSAMKQILLGVQDLLDSPNPASRRRARRTCSSPTTGWSTIRKLRRSPSLSAPESERVGVELESSETAVSEGGARIKYLASRKAW